MRNKQRVIDDGKKSVSATIKRAREVIQRVGPARGRAPALRFLDDVDQLVPQLSDVATGSVSRIEALLRKFPAKPMSDELILKAASRALNRRAPFHREKNSIDDAVILETYLEEIGRRTQGRLRFAFVTHNTKDFSDPIGDRRQPHPDLAQHFSRIRSIYSTALRDVIRRISPDLLADAIFDHEWSGELRNVSELGRRLTI